MPIELLSTELPMVVAPANNQPSMNGTLLTCTQANTILYNNILSAMKYNILHGNHVMNAEYVSPNNINRSVILHDNGTIHTIDINDIPDINHDEKHRYQMKKIYTVIPGTNPVVYAETEHYMPIESSSTESIDTAESVTAPVATKPAQRGKRLRSSSTLSNDTCTTLNIDSENDENCNNTKYFKSNTNDRIRPHIDTPSSSSSSCDQLFGNSIEYVTDDVLSVNDSISTPYSTTSEEQWTNELTPIHSNISSPEPFNSYNGNINDLYLTTPIQHDSFLLSHHDQSVHNSNNNIEKLLIDNRSLWQHINSRNNHHHHNELPHTFELVHDCMF